ncbi:hypothetical protein [Microbispora sp. NBC_01389]|uniref:hypothetical protein n=1 Tax=Microbispora sp. NBC_01389 TaxID=2903584 RepID=UPI00324CE33F
MSIPLSVGASTGQKTAATVAAAVFLVISGVGARVFLKVADEVFAGPDPLNAADGASPGFVMPVVALIALAAVGTIATVLLRTIRYGARLTGSVLDVQGAFTSGSADLATADVWLDSEPEYERRPGGEGRRHTGRRIPLLVAQGPSGPRIKLRLRDMNGALLPPRELTALADAVESGTRPEPKAAEVAAVLRRLAHDPLGRLL